MLRNLRWSGLVLMLAVLAGCTGLQQVWDRMTSDPVESALLVIEDQWQAARQEFYAQDIEVIRACLAAGEPKAVCAAKRCETSLCRAFRLDLDPKVTAAYNLALRMQTAPSTDAAGREALNALHVLAAIDPDRAQVYRGLSAAISEALRQLAERAPPQAPTADGRPSGTSPAGAGASPAARVMPTPSGARGAALG